MVKLSNYFIKLLLYYRFPLRFLQLRLAELEKRAVNDMFIVMSDVWLDNEEVINEDLL